MAHRNDELVNMNAKLSLKIDELINISNQGVDDNNTNTIVYLYDNNIDDPKNFFDAYMMLKSEVDSFKSEWELILTVFGTIIALFTLAIPLMNYGFIQKEQLDNFTEKSDKKLEDFESAKATAIKDVTKAKEDTISELQDQLLKTRGELDAIVKELLGNNTDIPNESDSQQEGNSTKLAMQYALKAKESFDNEDYETALELWNKAIEKNQSRDMYYISRSRVLIKLKEYEKAVCDAEMACKINPSPRNYEHLSHTFVMSDNKEKAIEVVSKAILLSPRDTSLYNNLLGQQYISNYFEEAIKTADEALKIAPRNTYALYIKSQSYEQLDKIAEAIDCMSKLLSIEPENTEYIERNEQLKKQLI